MLFQSESSGEATNYNRSTSLDTSMRYGGSGSDLSRLNHSRDYGRLAGSSERLEEERMADSYSYTSSSHDFNTSNHSSATYLQVYEEQ